MNIDTERLKSDLEDYFGTAMFTASPVAMADLIRVQKASEEELLEIARKEKIDISKYVISQDNYIDYR